MDIRKAREKYYNLRSGCAHQVGTIRTIIVMAKLRGEDTPSAIADWAKNHQKQLAMLKSIYF
jgi:hypothetical protein